MFRPQWIYRDGRAFRKFYWRRWDRGVDLLYRTLDVEPDDQDNFYKICMSADDTPPWQGDATIAEVSWIADEQKRRVAAYAKYATEWLELKKKFTRLQHAADDLNFAFEPYRLELRRDWGSRLRLAGGALRRAYEPYRLRIIKQLPGPDFELLQTLASEPPAKLARRTVTIAGKVYPLTILLRFRNGRYHV